MKKSNKIFASANFPVIVARLKNSKEDIKVRTFTCKDSGVSVISNYSAHPYSPITGGKLVPQNKKLLTLSSAEVDHLESLGICPNCGAELRAHASIASNMDNATFHCIVCGEELEVEETGDPAGYLEKIADNFEDASDTSKAGDPETTQMVESECEDCDEEETTQMEVDPEKAVESDITDENPEVPEEETTQMEVDPEKAVESEAEDAPAEENVEENKETDEEVAPEDEEIRVDMLSRCEAGLNSKKIEVISSGKDTFHYVMVANKPVATLHRSRANAEVQEIFSNTNLLNQALSAAIEKEGISKAVISSFGLVPMILKVKASEAIQKAVDDKVDEMTTQMELQKDSMEEDYQQSLGIAAVAVNKNLFDDTKNVLAEDLIDNLEQIGVEDARDIVESSFKNYGEEYLRTIVAKASEYKSKSAEVRNELANTVMASNFKSGKLNMNHVATASVKESLNAEDVNKYRSLFNKK